MVAAGGDFGLKSHQDLALHDRHLNPAHLGVEGVLFPPPHCSGCFKLWDVNI